MSHWFKRKNPTEEITAAAIIERIKCGSNFISKKPAWREAGINRMPDNIVVRKKSTNIMLRGLNLSLTFLVTTIYNDHEIRPPTTKKLPSGVPKENVS